MYPIMPWWLVNSDDYDRPPRRQPVDWATRLINWLFGVTAVALVVVAWLLGQSFAESVAPTIVEWQSRFVDATSSHTPPLPPLPDSPFPK